MKIPASGVVSSLSQVALTCENLALPRKVSANSSPCRSALRSSQIRSTMIAQAKIENPGEDRESGQDDQHADRELPQVAHEREDSGIDLKKEQRRPRQSVREPRRSHPTQTTCLTSSRYHFAFHVSSARRLRQPT